MALQVNQSAKPHKANGENPTVFNRREMRNRGVRMQLYTTDDIKAKIAPIAGKYQLHSVYLFGSYARNEATSSSDLDVLVDITDSVVKGWIIGGLYNDFCDAFDMEVDMVTTDAVRQYENETPWFAENVMMEKVLVYER